MKRAKKSLFFGIEDHKTHRTRRVDVVKPPVITHGLAYPQFVSAAARIIERRLC